MARPFLHDIALAVAIMLATAALHLLKDLTTITGEIRVHLATVAQQVLEHDRRIGRLERPSE